MNLNFLEINISVCVERLFEMIVTLVELVTLGIIEVLINVCLVTVLQTGIQ